MAFAALMYHSLADGRFPDASYPKYTTTGETFTRHLKLLRHRGHNIGSCASVLELAKGGQRIPDNFCALTFDDGHKSSLDLAERMQAEGVRGTFFLTMNYCRDRADFLKPGEIRGLAAAGFDFGAHGASHRALSEMPAAEMRAELRDSKRWLEDILGAPVNALSLPAGQGSAAVRTAAWELGYTLVGNSVERMNRHLTLPGELNRFVILRGHSAAQVCRIAAGAPGYILRRRLRAALLMLPKRILRTYDHTRS